MARPRKETVDYFPHDADASNGDTLTIIEGQFGNDGYAFWFKLLERISSTENHVIDCRNPVKWQLLLAKTHVTEEKGEAILKTLSTLEAIDRDLWENDRVIWCQKLVDRVSDAYRNRKSEIPQKPVSDVINKVSDNKILVSDTENPQRKLKETKVKEIKDIYGTFQNVLLTTEEYTKLKERFNSHVEEMIERLSEGIASKGYKYKSHYAAILSWERMNKERNIKPAQKTNNDEPVKGW